MSTLFLLEPVVEELDLTTRPLRVCLVFDEDSVAATRATRITIFVPSEACREQNGGDYAGGTLIATTPGGIYRRSWDTSDWDHEYRWCDCAPVASHDELVSWDVAASATRAEGARKHGQAL